jgi:hypothetical protein
VISPSSSCCSCSSCAIFCSSTDSCTPRDATDDRRAATSLRHTSSSRSQLSCVRSSSRTCFLRSASCAHVTETHATCEVNDDNMTKRHASAVPPPSAASARSPARLAVAHPLPRAQETRARLWPRTGCLDALSLPPHHPPPHCRRCPCCRRGCSRSCLDSSCCCWMPWATPAAQSGPCWRPTASGNAHPRPTSSAAAADAAVASRGSRHFPQCLHRHSQRRRRLALTAATA